MNYIRHLNAFFRHTGSHPEWDSYHLSMYYALFHLWNATHFEPVFSISRDDLMKLSRIGSKDKYYDCLEVLQASGMIKVASFPGTKKPIRVTMLALAMPDEKEQHEDTLSDSSIDASMLSLPADTCTGNGTNAIPDPVHICPETSTSDVLNRVHIGAESRTLHVPFSGPFLKPSINIFKTERVALPAPALTKKNGVNQFNAAEVKAPPDFSSVAAFFSKAGYPILEGEKFFYYYQSRGWKVGPSIKIVDWESAAHKWMRSDNVQERIAINISKYARNQHLHTSDDKDYTEPL